MAQVGLFDFEERYQQLQAQGDPLALAQRGHSREKFRPTLEKVREKERKDNSGRKPFDVVLMFKILILQSLYNFPTRTPNIRSATASASCIFSASSSTAGCPTKKRFGSSRTP